MSGAAPADIDAAIDGPIVVTGRGGSGTRLASQALQGLGVFLGNRLNHTDDSPEWVDPVYPLAVASLTGDRDRLARSRDELRTRGSEVLAAGQWRRGQPWGWKLPETMLVLPLVAAAFARVRIVHVVRHPLDVCLRRSHVTSRMANPVGRAVLAAAWERYGLPGSPAPGDDPINNAASWRLQLDDAIAFEAGFDPARLLRVRYEDLCADRGAGGAAIAAFLRLPAQAAPSFEVDEARRSAWRRDDPAAAAVWALCEPTATRLGYGFPADA